ncbi:phage portal protein [Methylorubrum extorquens]|uniref:phage portal protein n=1 Tax=Methylorubrum extorquens TaxID=408 RepID=UPI001EE554D1|nr:phage portal protein [Methylorubrum extorquens]MCG5247973.1 phage portal protein [Methylorubrum extorquens]
MALDLAGGAGAAASTPYEVAGGSGRRSRAWRVGSWGPNAAITYALDELRRKSRDLSRKNAFAGAAVDKLVDNIIGTGIVPRSIAARSVVGLSEEQAKRVKREDAEFRAALQSLFLAWTDEADSVGAHDFYGLQAIAVTGMVEGGESFTRLRTRLLSDGLTVPLQLQVLEGDHCDHMKTDATNRIRQGIQFSAIGGRTGYYLRREHPGDAFMSTGGIDEALVPAGDVCHLYRARRPGQDRGEPWLARALRTLYDLDQYFDAELVRKKNAARLVAFIKRSLDAGEEGDPGSGPMGSDPADDGVAVIEMEPGTVQVLADGEDVEMCEPTDVGANFEPFVREAKRSVAAAVGLLYEVLSGDYSQMDDRTLRAALNDFRRSVERWQHHLVVYQFCRPIWRRWIDLALLSGALKLPAGMTRQQAYAVEWVPQAWSYIHPVQDVEGKMKEVQAGFSTRTRVVARAGYDVEQVDAENAADNSRADELKLSYTSDGRKAEKAPATAASAQPDDPPQPGTPQTT